jgi:hypothetical protein
LNGAQGATGAQGAAGSTGAQGATGPQGPGANQTLNTTSAVTFAGLTINGAITATGDITAFSSSDITLKTNIAVIESALDKLIKLQGITYNWKDGVEGKDPELREAGVIAQQVLEALPEIVAMREDGTLAVRYERLIPLLIEAIKELNDKIEGR